MWNRKLRIIIGLMRQDKDGLRMIVECGTILIVLGFIT